MQFSDGELTKADGVGFVLPGLGTCIPGVRVVLRLSFGEASGCLEEGCVVLKGVRVRAEGFETRVDLITFRISDSFAEVHTR